MFSVVLVASALTAFVQDSAPETRASELAAYEAAAARAGRDAKAHVRLALWCEERGLSSQRLKQLAAAVLYDPANVLARGLMGLVENRGKWDRPEVVAKQIQTDQAYQDLVRGYVDRRARTATKPDAQLKLAAWCEQKGLKEQALAHYNEVIRMDPAREAAWKHLGFQKLRSRWVKPEELAAEKQEAARQKQADKLWRPKLEKLLNDLLSKDTARRTRAEQGLTKVTEPRAVPMIWAIFTRANERSQLAAVQMLGQIDGPTATNALAALAIFSADPEVRNRATGTLKHRDPRDVVGRLITMIHKPFKYQVRPVNGPGSPGELFVEGERFNIQRFYENLQIVPMSRLFTPDIPFNPFSTANILTAMLGSQFSTLAATGIPTILGPGGFPAAFPLRCPLRSCPTSPIRPAKRLRPTPRMPQRFSISS
jgi:tetratricopeptide (TPR) repeat protein